MSQDELPKVAAALREHRPPPIELGTELIAIMTEAVRNARNHSDAHIVTIEGFVNHDVGSISIADDGQGFDTGKHYKGHYGLVGMEERARKIGAELDVQSSPSGTTITVTWGAE